MMQRHYNPDVHNGSCIVTDISVVRHWFIGGSTTS